MVIQNQLAIALKADLGSFRRDLQGLTQEVAGVEQRIKQVFDFARTGLKGVAGGAKVVTDATAGMVPDQAFQELLSQADALGPVKARLELVAEGSEGLEAVLKRLNLIAGETGSAFAPPLENTNVWGQAIRPC